MPSRQATEEMRKAAGAKPAPEAPRAATSPAMATTLNSGKVEMSPSRLNMPIMRVVMRKPPPMFIAEANTARGASAMDQPADDGEPGDGVGEGHQRGVQGGGDPADGGGAGEAGQREDRDHGDVHGGARDRQGRHGGAPDGGALGGGEAALARLPGHALLLGLLLLLLGHVDGDRGDLGDVAL